jgi:ATP-dependent protease HslVU (ClpYQ) peptidase subunit
LRKQRKSAMLAGSTAKRLFSDLERAQRAKIRQLVTFVMFSGKDWTPDEKSQLQTMLSTENVMQDVFLALADGEYHDAEEIINTRLPFNTEGK